MKRCTKCKIEKSLEEFYKNKKMKDGYSYNCKECTREANSKACEKYRLTSKGIKNQRKTWLKFKYNLTIEDYHKMLKEQKGLCGICNLPMKDKEICIDHCHKTNKVRGLLHRTCNAGLGLFKEDENILRSAINYINR